MKQLQDSTGQPSPQFVLNFNAKPSTRTDLRREQSQRVKDSPSLAEKFPSLKALKVRLWFFERRTGAGGVNSEVKYTVNLAHAKSLFQFGCRNPECINGDFDLSDEVARAVRGRRRKASGELHCQGWRGAENVNLIRCNKMLRFELILGY